MILIAIGLLSIMGVLNYSLSFIEKSRQKVVAINLAREGIEAVYQIRNTNRQRWAGVKEACWLKSNPLAKEGLDDNCSTDSWIVSGSYILVQNVTTNGQQYFSLSGVENNSLQLGTDVTIPMMDYLLCESDGTRSACPGNTAITSGEKYFREIYVYELLDKENDSSIECVTSNGPSPLCNTTSAKELRFCSKVVYVSSTWGEVKFCGVLTNFAKK